MTPEGRSPPNLVPGISQAELDARLLLNSANVRRSGS